VNCARIQDAATLAATPPRLPMVLAYLERLQKSGYPYSELGLRTAQDNQGPAVTISDTIRDWNAHWRFPRLIFSTNYQFLQTMEERH
jgi:hypothetical protein